MCLFFAAVDFTARVWTSSVRESCANLGRRQCWLQPAPPNCLQISAMSWSSSLGRWRLLFLPMPKKKKAMNGFWKYLTCRKLFNTFFPEQEGKSRKRMVFSFFFLFWCVKNLGFGFHLENAKRETLPVWEWNTAIGFGQSKALSRKTATTIPLS